MKYDVFISYSSHDQKIVEGLCAYLEQHKIRCFVAYRDIPRGVVWARAIVDALDESRMMLVVFSEHFNNSDQVDREIELASEDKKPILTFRISDETFKGAKKYYLKNLNWIDAFPDPQAVFGDVAVNVARLLDIRLNINVGALEEKKVVVPEPTPDPVPEIEPTTYKVGDFYDDGTKQGVVFEVSEDGKHGKIVSLNEALLQWCTDEQYDEDIRVGANSDRDGKINTDIVMQGCDCANYPPFMWCREQGKEWYLPSKKELMAIYDVKDLVNKTLAQYSYREITNDWYWSSTEYDEDCAWSVDMYNGNTYDTNKYNLGYVRVVSAF